MDAWCDFGLCGDKLTWNLQGEVLFIDGEGRMDNYSRNASIWEPLAWLVRSVIISRGVTSIGSYAFGGFTNLTDISIPDTVTEIGEGTFSGCTRLTSVFIPSRVIIISRDAFEDCPNLQQITVAVNNPRYCSLKCDKNFTGLRIVPKKPRKCYFAVNENDCVFRIETGETGAGSSHIGSYGDFDTLIEIREALGIIIDIECIYLGNVISEPNLWLTDIRNNPDLEQLCYPYCGEYAYGERFPCVVNVVRNEMDVIISKNTDKVCAYYVKDRMEYYFDGEGTLVYFKVVNLTEEETEFLSR